MISMNREHGYCDVDIWILVIDMVECTKIVASVTQYVFGIYQSTHGMPLKSH